MGLRMNQYLLVVNIAPLDVNKPCYDINMVNMVMSELDNDIIDGLTKGMDIGNMVKFRESI